MLDNIQDELISYENISYPVKISKWEIYKVKDFEKYYVKIYFSKANDSVKEFSINIDCFSSAGDKIDEQSNISVSVDNKSDCEFFKIFPLNAAAEKISIKIVNCTFDEPKTPKSKIKAISVYELVTYAVSAIAVLFYMFVTPFWYDIISWILLTVFSACAVGLSVYWLVKKNKSFVMQIILPITAVLAIISLRVLI